MSPKVADPAIRVALIENAARITAEEGREALTLRRLATEVGASTMAVYTHFGGMDELRREVRREGFARLAAHLADVQHTDDPVADLIVSGLAYYTNAITNPNLYRAMFMDGPWDDQDRGVGLDTFETLVAAVARCVDEGRFHPAEPRDLATTIWAMSHGVISLELAGMLPDENAVHALRSGARSLLLAFGDTLPAIERSYRQATRQ